MKCKDCKPQAAGGASVANCVAGTYQQFKCYAVGENCAGKAVYERTLDANCTVLAFSYKDGDGLPITEAQWNAIETIPCPDRGFNCAPKLPEFCEYFQGALKTPVAPAPTDKIIVSRGTGCETVELQALLLDVQIASLVPIAFDETTATFSFTITETNGDTYPASYTLPKPAPESHVTPATISIGGVPVVGTGPELQAFDLPAYKTYCELLSAAAATPVAALPTDKIVVSRGTGCATVELQALLTDVQIASLVPIAFDEPTGTFTFTITETNGDTYPATWTLPQPAPETPLVVVLKDAAGTDITATNVVQSGTANHIAEITLPAQTVDINVSNLTLDAAGNLVLTETDGQQLQVTIPASPALVLTVNGSTAGVTQSGVLGHVTNITIPPETPETPLVANDSTTIDFTQTGTAGHTFTGAVKIDPVAGNKIVAGPNGLRVIESCDNGQPAIPLCPTDEFVGCGGQKYTLPDTPAEPLLQSVVASASISPSLLLGSPVPTPSFTVIDSKADIKGGTQAGFEGIYGSNGPVPANFTISGLPDAQLGDVVVVTMSGDLAWYGIPNTITVAGVTTALPISNLTIVDESLGFAQNGSCRAGTWNKVFAFRLAAAGPIGNIVIPAVDVNGSGQYILGGVAQAVLVRPAQKTGPIFSAIDAVTAYATRPGTYTTPTSQTFTTTVDPTEKTLVVMQARHIGLSPGPSSSTMTSGNGISVFSGPSAAIIADANPIGGFICNIYTAAATVDGNVFTLGYNVNANQPGDPACPTGGSDSWGNAAALQFVPAPSTGGSFITAPIPALAVTNTYGVTCNPCDPAGSYITHAVYHSGIVSAVVPAETTYRIDYTLNGNLVGAVTISNPHSSAQTITGGGVVFSDYSDPSLCSSTTQFVGSATATLVSGVATGADIQITGSKIVVKGILL